MVGITDEYKREKLLNWRPNWDPATINSWSGNQLEKIYRRVQQEILMGIQEQLDYRVMKKE